MINEITSNGVVLVQSPVGEYDSRVEILTTGSGRISAFARGARRQNSPLSACVMPFTFAEFKLIEGRNSCTLTNASIKKYFDEIGNDYDKLCMASYFAELLRYFTRENVEAVREVNLFFYGLNALVKGLVNPALIRLVFEERLLLIEGIAPELYRCMKCSRPVNSDNARLFISKGSMVCDDCQKKFKEFAGLPGIKFSHDALYALRYIHTAYPQKLFSFELKEEVFEELKKYMKEYMQAYVDYKFRSLKFLE
ncbi:MAG: DNA repair protein RecO [Lachnospiraceae bacterium]|jgi:DNA repair protein RecO (recombination protein O)|nr:DNA repair protein RecO [Lachnospiraceae bacterium]MEE3460660.1 DNA repair protein RecO [Lachnospiraceae bacterium]